MLNERSRGVASACDRVGLDAIAIKPTESDLSAVDEVPVETIAIDYEGRDALPDASTLERLAERHDVRTTTPVRADGFDPLGDDSLVDTLPSDVGRILVAGHPAYLSPDERSRAIAPRLGAAVEAVPDAWVGTESVERIALATGAAQFELLSGSTERAVRALRAAGFDGEIAVYAPTVLTADEDAILDAVGEYVARRGSVAADLPDEAPTDAGATGAVRETLLEAAKSYALVGDVATVGARIDRFRSAGVTTVVGYPARGLDHLLE
ncbi:DUF7388 family protein [Halovivax limisalsi]|uniref:DUF7388 family protein n=1 Tax=Halovivax limisalsi TaxID=1453760 RepID=UPI001FFC355A|nr:luciferase [Halovivax limisalsi]